VRLSGGSSATPAESRPAPETRSTTPTTVRPGSGTKTTYSIESANALARRVRAQALGASTPELSAGDADAAAAEALARDGNYAAASARLASAIDKWDAVATAAQGRPRQGGVARGQGIRAEAEQVAAEFADAFSAKSLPRLRTVYPRISEDQAQQFAQQFLGIRDVSMQLHASDVNRLGPLEAQATFSGTYDYTEMQGAAGSRAVTWQVTLRQTAMGWRIIAMR
jgi:hypothetical protein